MLQCVALNLKTRNQNEIYMERGLRNVHFSKFPILIHGFDCPIELFAQGFREELFYGDIELFRKYDGETWVDVILYFKREHTRMWDESCYCVGETYNF